MLGCMLGKFWWGGQDHHALANTPCLRGGRAGAGRPPSQEGAALTRHRPGLGVGALQPWRCCTRCGHGLSGGPLGMQLQQWRLDMESQALWERGETGEQDTVRCTCSLVRTIFPTLFVPGPPFLSKIQRANSSTARLETNVVSMVWVWQRFLTMRIQEMTGTYGEFLRIGETSQLFGKQACIDMILNISCYPGYIYIHTYACVCICSYFHIFIYLYIYTYTHIFYTLAVVFEAKLYWIMSLLLFLIISSYMYLYSILLLYPYLTCHKFNFLWGDC